MIFFFKLFKSSIIQRNRDTKNLRALYHKLNIFSFFFLKSVVVKYQNKEFFFCFSSSIFIFSCNFLSCCITLFSKITILMVCHIHWSRQEIWKKKRFFREMKFWQIQGLNAWKFMHFSADLILRENSKFWDSILTKIGFT